MKKRELCLIFGGKSKEYEVSLMSAECVLKYIDREKYAVNLLGITRDGMWYIYYGDEQRIGTGEWAEDKRKYPVAFCPNTKKLIYGDNFEKSLRPDLVLPMVHGGYGEDGRIQGLFNIMGIDCRGVDVDGAVLTLNKHITKLIAKEMSVPVADFYILRRDEDISLNYIYRAAEELTYPLFVKADSGGSSIGVFKVKTRDELLYRINDAFAHSSVVLLEKAIKGAEVEIGVIEKNGELHLGKIGQISHGSEFYDYITKYKKGDSVCVIPAKISEKCEKTIREYARKLFVGALCRGFCRIDFFVTENEDVIFNEINAIPGFTSGSMFPLLMQDKERGIGGVIDDILVD